MSVEQSRKEYYNGSLSQRARVLEWRLRWLGKLLVFRQIRGRINGLDLSEVQYAIFQRHGLNSGWADTGLKNNSFDLVVTELLRHVDPFVNECGNEILRILKPGGWAGMW